MTSEAPPRPNLSWPRVIPTWFIPVGIGIAVLGAGMFIFALATGYTRGFGAGLGPVLGAAGGCLSLAPWRNRLDREGRLRVRHDALFTLGPWAAVIMLVTAVAPGVLLGQMSNCIMFPLAAFAGTLISPRRRGTTRLCAGCEYPFIDDSRSAVCPECALAWREPSGTVVGERERPARLRAYGFLLLAIALIAPFAWLLGRSVYQRMLPVPALSWLARHESWQKEDTWKELTARSLSPQQQRDLATLILDQRLRREPFQSMTGNAWLNGEYLAKRLPADIEQRFLEEQLRPYLIGPDRLRVGQSANVVLLGQQGQFVGSPLDAQIALRGFTLSRGAGSTEDHATVWAYQVGDTSIALTGAYQSALTTPKSPHIQITPDAPGSLTVTCTLWVVLFSAPAPHKEFVWNTGGEPAIPASAVWSKRYELQHTISVEP